MQIFVDESDASVPKRAKRAPQNRLKRHIQNQRENVGEGLLKDQENVDNRVCLALRNHQWKTNTSDKQLAATLDLMKEIGDLLRCGAELPANIRSADRPLREKVIFFDFPQI